MPVINATLSSWCILVYFLLSISVTDGELKRLKDAFKRSSTLNGYMTKSVFIKEVLGDGVPPRLAEVNILLKKPELRKLAHKAETIFLEIPENSDL